MAKLEREAFLERIKSRIGETPSDEDIAFLEDMTDTFDGFSGTFTQNDIDTAVKAKDEEWRKKYAERFFDTGSKPSGDCSGEPDDKEDEAEKITIEDLYTDKED